MKGMHLNMYYRRSEPLRMPLLATPISHIEPHLHEYIPGTKATTTAVATLIHQAISVTR